MMNEWHFQTYSQLRKSLAAVPSVRAAPAAVSSSSSKSMGGPRWVASNMASPASPRKMGSSTDPRNAPSCVLPGHVCWVYHLFLPRAFHRLQTYCLAPLCGVWHRLQIVKIPRFYPPCSILPVILIVSGYRSYCKCESVIRQVNNSWRVLN